MLKLSCVLVRPFRTASNNSEKPLERADTTCDPALSNATVHRRLVVQNSLLYFLRQRFAKYRLNRLRQQLRIVLVDVRQLDREVYRSAVVDVGPAQWATLAATSAIQTGHSVSTGKQGGVQASIHADPAEHSVQ